MMFMNLFDANRPLQIADQGCFFVGGQYIETDAGSVMSGQMFVQYQIPGNLRCPYPLVMIHGGGQTAVNFLCTPDGRRGWADFFVANGYAVYVVDQPGRGRSGYFPGSYGKSESRSAEVIERRFTAPEKTARWPQAKLHTQWPGDGSTGDPVFDQFYASQVNSMSDMAQLEGLMRNAGSELLDRIGPALLLTHSQSGPFGWTIADARSGLVRGIVAVEPSGGPFIDLKFEESSNCLEEGQIARPWGITRGAIRFEPFASSATDIRFIRQDKPDGPELACCWLQAEPARQLPNLKGIPVLVLTSAASYHASYDHCTSLFLRQAGVENDFVRLPEVGIHGNGHMMMLEKNNLEIAEFIRSWFEKKVH
jgi:pimeloyl-ACP methyl ester carboxylesterase